MKFLTETLHRVVSNLEDFTTPVKEISPRQLDICYRKRDVSFCNKKLPIHLSVNLLDRNVQQKLGRLHELN